MMMWKCEQNDEKWESEQSFGKFLPSEKLEEVFEDKIDMCQACGRISQNVILILWYSSFI